MRGIHVRQDEDWVWSQIVDRTVEVNFAPSYVVAKSSVAGVGGRDFALAFIGEYRRRPDPNGAEERVSVREHEPSFIFGNQISSVTFWRHVQAEPQGSFFFRVVSEIQFW